MRCGLGARGRGDDQGAERATGGAGGDAGSRRSRLESVAGAAHPMVQSEAGLNDADDALQSETADKERSDLLLCP